MVEGSMLRSRHHRKVFRPVVALVAIDMMNNLVLRQRPPEDLLLQKHMRSTLPPVNCYSLIIRIRHPLFSRLFFY